MTNENGFSHTITSKLHIVDLAGSEKAKDTGQMHERIKEANKINLSLSTLGRVINQLAKGEAHISYRDSILTRVLKDSLSGNSNVVMICNVNPH